MANAQIRENVSIGKKSIISKDVYIDKNVNAFTLVTGNPAVEIAKINKKVLELNYLMFTNKKICIEVIELGKMGKSYLNIFSFLNSV